MLLRAEWPSQEHRRMTPPFPCSGFTGLPPAFFQRSHKIHTSRNGNSPVLHAGKGSPYGYGAKKAQQAKGSSTGDQPPPAPRSGCRSQSLLLHPYRLLNQFVQARRSNAADHILQLHPFQIQNRQRDGFQAIFASYVRIGIRINQHGKRLAVLRFGIRFYRLDVIHGRAAPRSVKNKEHLAAG